VEKACEFVSILIFFLFILCVSLSIEAKNKEIISTISDYNTRIYYEGVFYTLHVT